MAPKTKEEYEKIRRKRKEAIKAVALELFARYGFHYTSISRIAKEARVSKGLMYNYFDSKEALLESIIMDAVEIGERLMKESLENKATPREQLRGLTEGTILMVKENFHYLKLLIALAFQPDALKSMESFFDKEKDKTIARLSLLFEQMGVEDPEKEAYYYGAVLDGLILHYMQLGEEYPLEEMKKYILKKLNLE
jgi:AcrR family transcriptional regulator